MIDISFTSSAPGSLMLFGEHAVLYGMHALCGAVDQRIKVTLTPQRGQQIHLHSSALGDCTVKLDSFVVQPPFQFVLMAIDHFRPQLPSGFDLVITAEFAATLGLGSSAAVTVATIGVLARWLQLSLSSFELFAIAKQVIQRVQGVGSGADVAAAVFGGVVAYRMEPQEIKLLATLPTIALVYSGAKVPTANVVQQVKEQREHQLTHYQALFQAIDACTQAAVMAVEQQNWSALGVLMNEHQDLQWALGVSTPLLDELIADLRRQPGILGAKISGSGLGDCVIGLGAITADLFPTSVAQQTAGVKQISINLTNTGYCSYE